MMMMMILLSRINDPCQCGATDLCVTSCFISLSIIVFCDHILLTVYSHPSMTTFGDFGEFGDNWKKEVVSVWIGHMAHSWSVQECLSNKNRSIFGNINGFGFSMATISLSGISYLLKDWKYIQLATTLPLLLIIIFVLLIPESPRWLISVGKFDEALITMKKIAKINGQTLPSDETIMAELRELEYKIKNKSQNQASIADLFRTKNMRRKTIILYYICCHDSRDVETSESNTDTTTTTFSFPGPNVWQAVTLKHGIETAATRQQQFANQGLTCNRFVVALIYFALSLNMQDLGGDLFVSMAIAGSLNIFGYFLTVLVMSKIGRRIPTAASLIVGGVFLAMSMLLPKSVGWLNIIIVLIGRTAISMTFSLIYVFTPEVHPTVDDISSPYISKTILAVLAITAGLSTLGLPETKDRNLPETLEDGENYEL
ncbi:Solute carrier family 22 member 3 [Nymphon striatum]|nr:Solute carrier family 22 member 3 [Nymphon striatum]